MGWQEVPGTKGRTWRLEVPGGWLYRDRSIGDYSQTMCFVPVAHMVAPMPVFIEAPKELSR